MRAFLLCVIIYTPTVHCLCGTHVLLCGSLNVCSIYTHVQNLWDTCLLILCSLSKLGLQPSVKSASFDTGPSAGRAGRPGALPVVLYVTPWTPLSLTRHRGHCRDDTRRRLLTPTKRCTTTTTTATGLSAPPPALT